MDFEQRADPLTLDGDEWRVRHPEILSFGASLHLAEQEARNPPFGRQVTGLVRSPHLWAVEPRTLQARSGLLAELKRESGLPVSVSLPALNEQTTLR